MGARPSETTPKMCTLTQGQDKYMSLRILSPKLKIKPIKMTGPWLYVTFLLLVAAVFYSRARADRIMSRTAHSRPQPTKTFVVIIVKSIIDHSLQKCI